MSGTADGTGTQAMFNFPYGLAFDSSGNLFVADYSNHLIRKVSPEGRDVWIDVGVVVFGLLTIFTFVTSFLNDINNWVCLFVCLCVFVC